LPDLYFTASRVKNELYINKGDFQFKNTTEKSGTASADKWSSSASVVDINNDGKVNSTDKYLAKKREAISKAIAKGKQEEEEQLKKMEHNMHGDALYVWHHLLHSKKYSPQDAMKVLNLAKGAFEHLL
jgi:hypothetical protein